MHVLHGTWLLRQQRFVLWGEDSAVPPKRRGGKRARLIPHPYLVSTTEWRRHLRRYAPDAEPQPHDGVVWLPGVGGWPLPSPRAREEGMASPEGALRLLGWRLRAGVTLNPIEALAYLVRLPRQDQPQRGFVVGGDLRLWQRAALLAMGCLVEQRYLPGLEERGGALFASWRPQPDGEILSQLEAAMPPASRAHEDNPSQTPSAMELLDAFLNTTIDAFIRAADLAPRGAVHPWMRALIGTVRRVGGDAAGTEGRRLWGAWR